MGFCCCLCPVVFRRALYRSCRVLRRLDRLLQGFKEFLCNSRDPTCLMVLTSIGCNTAVAFCLMMFTTTPTNILDLVL